MRNVSSSLHNLSSPAINNWDAQYILITCVHVCVYVVTFVFFLPLLSISCFLDELPFFEIILLFSLLLFPSDVSCVYITTPAPPILTAAAAERRRRCSSLIQESSAMESFS